MKTGANAIDLLKRQHPEVRDLFTQIEEETDEDEKQELVQELADILAAHAVIEEKLFYPVAYANASEDLQREAMEDHQSVRRMVARLLDMSVDDEEFEEKLELLRDQISEHVDEEENEVFPMVRRELKAPELRKLGEEMQLLFEQELEGPLSQRNPVRPRAPIQPQLR